MKAGGKEACKGLVGIGGKLIEKQITENKILKKASKINYRVGDVGKFGINAGV